MKKPSPPSPPSRSVSRTTGPSSSIGKRRRGSSLSAASSATRKNPRPLPPPVVNAPPPTPPLIVDIACTFCKRDRAIWAPDCCNKRTYCGHCKNTVKELGIGCPSCNSPVNPTWVMKAWASEAGGEAQGGDAPAPLQ